MQWFTALIPAYPHVQKRAQAELDRVVGRSRLPNLEDEIELPYCHAIIKEVERCHNPFWLGTPHTATSDFMYHGKMIPKDTVVVLNTYSMHHDSNRWENPLEFNVSSLPGTCVRTLAEYYSLSATLPILHYRLRPPISPILICVIIGCLGLVGAFALACFLQNARSGLLSRVCFGLLIGSRFPTNRSI